MTHYRAIVSVDGSGNGSTATTPTLSGDALIAQTAGGVTAGLFEPQGDDNTLNASITGDKNLCGTLQNGILNDITATVNGNGSLTVQIWLKLTQAI